MLLGMEFLFGEDENVQKLDCHVGFTTVNILKPTELYI